MSELCCIAAWSAPDGGPSHTVLWLRRPIMLATQSWQCANCSVQIVCGSSDYSVVTNTHKQAFK